MAGHQQKLRYKRNLSHTGYRAEIAIIDGTAMKGRRIIVPEILQDKSLKQLYFYGMGIGKTGMLVHDSIYLVNMSTNIEEMINTAPYTLISRQHDYKTK